MHSIRNITNAVGLSDVLSETLYRMKINYVNSDKLVVKTGEINLVSVS